MLFGTTIFSQIKTLKVESVEKEKVYDSTKNFLGEDAELYKGATLYVKGMIKSCQDYGYSGFKTKPKIDDYLQRYTYKKGAPKNEYNSKYESLVNINFEVLNVEKVNDILIHYILTLKNLNDGSIIYYLYGEYDNDISFPFIDMRYYEKMKNVFLGQEFIIQDKGGKTVTYANNIKIDSIWKYKWKCTDLVIEDNLYCLSLQLENDNGLKIAFPISYINIGEIISYKINKEKYGIYWDKIMQNKVSLGMNKDMVKLSWGEPEDINKTILKNSVSEQWVYEYNNYVYFDDGIVTAIQ
jgi:hypothetical protein